MVEVSQVAKNIFLIDNGLYSLKGFGAVYLINEEKKALIDTGPTTSVGNVLAGIRQIGVNPGDIDYVIATHIHLDHTGGAGMLIREMPRAQVFAHYKGARHLVDPSKLVSSVAEVDGKEALAKNGEVAPIETNRVTPVRDGDTLKLSNDQMLRFMEAPGHAPHELCIYESRNKGVFLGDAVGIYLAQTNLLLPVTPPPSFNTRSYVETIDKLIRLKATRLYFAHFGAQSQVEGILRRAKDKAQGWEDSAAGCRDDGRLAGEFTAQRTADLEPAKDTPLYGHLVDINVRLGVAGLMKYYREKCEANS
ncbi:MAG: MBL fold metallo-hydrolase [Dehalococcoidales bacterium]|nr:MBL fold metallo-hydrolase [Dehalococcoidales bacterium]